MFLGQLPTQALADHGPATGDSLGDRIQIHYAAIGVDGKGALVNLAGCQGTLSGTVPKGSGRSADVTWILRGKFHDRSRSLIL